MDVKHVAKLANLKLTPDEETKFAKQFADTLKVVEEMTALDTSGVEPTSQVTGLTNVTRADVVESEKVLTQEAVLSQAADTSQGYIKVPAVLAGQ